VDWAAAVEVRPSRGWALGLSFQSDLADLQEALLADSNDRYRRRIPAAGVYAVWTAPGFDLSFEIVSALRAFEGLGSDRDRPLAWNPEFAHFINHGFEWALRWEGGRDLEDAPQYQAGLALTWRPVPHASLSIEYLHGWFSGNLETGSSDQPYARWHHIGAKLSVVF
jgi:hypothetical protein